MTERGGARTLLVGLLLLGACVFAVGINWGLPSRQIDPILFSDRPVWTGQQIAQLAGEREPGQRIGADVDPNPIARRDVPVVLNDTDAARAEIIRRFRLYTFQPDEMITMMALASMRPSQGDFDPKLYQYGGLWIYPVAALIKLTLNPSPSQSWYLDHPEQFARFYIVARLYTVGWALIGLAAVFGIARAAGGGLLAAAVSGLLYIFMPVVVNLSHEAKPHLPGAVLMLLAAMAAGRFVNSGATRWWIAAAGLCGAAIGMVLSGLLALLIPPIMVLLRPMTWARRARIVLASGAIAFAVYFATNPYVLVHLLGDRAVLESNLRNTRAMYEVGRVLEGAVNAAKLMIEGASPLVMLVGLLGAVLIWRSNAAPHTAVLRILSAVSAVIVVQFMLLAAGKPGEYGRFAVLPDIVLGICAAVLAGRARIRTFERVQVVVILVALTVLPGIIYLRGFVRDATSAARRIEDAMLLEGLKQLGARRLGIWAEPAPYSLPPLDLFHWQIVLLPRGSDPLATQADAQYDVLLRPVDVLRTQPAIAGHRYRLISQRTFDDLFPARISWAAKPFEIWVRADLLQVSTRPTTASSP